MRRTELSSSGRIMSEEANPLNFKENRSKITIAEKLKVARKVREYKVIYDEQVAEAKSNPSWDSKRKRWVVGRPREGYLAKAVRKVYADLRDTKNDDPNFENAVKYAKRWYDNLENGTLAETSNPKKFRAAGAGRKVRAPEAKEALWDWFVDVRTAMKGRIPRKLFKLKAIELYDKWLEQNPIPEVERLTFSKHWIQDWDKDYGVSLRKPNKRHSISKEDCVIRVTDYLKNIWTVRRYFSFHFGCEPPIYNGDQMPVHQNEVSEQKTLSLKNSETFVKENHHLSRERATAFTKICSDGKMLMPEFVFNGTGRRVKLQAPEGIKFHWASKGSYRLETMLASIKNLPNRFNVFIQDNSAIYVLDDYAVHLMGRCL